jgi:hypothetical protein
MTNRQPRARKVKRIRPPPEPEEGYDAIIAYFNKYSTEELEKAGYLEEPSPEEIRELEESAERHLERENVKGLAKEYPKANRQHKAKWNALLSCVPGLKSDERKDMANALNMRTGHTTWTRSPIVSCKRIILLRRSQSYFSLSTRCWIIFAPTRIPSALAC